MFKDIHSSRVSNSFPVVKTLKDLANEVLNNKDYRDVTSHTTGIPEVSI